MIAMTYFAGDKMPGFLPANAVSRKNGMLIAAAPDLLAALETTIRALEQARPLVVAHYNASTEGANDLNLMRHAVKDARAAIARATGEPFAV